MINNNLREICFESKKERPESIRRLIKLKISKALLLSIEKEILFSETNIRIAGGIDYTDIDTFVRQYVSTMPHGNYNRLIVITVVTLQMCHRYILLLLRDSLIVSFVIDSLNYLDQLTPSRSSVTTTLSRYRTLHPHMILPITLPLSFGNNRKRAGVSYRQ